MYKRLSILIPDGIVTTSLSFTSLSECAEVLHDNLLLFSMCVEAFSGGIDELRFMNCDIWEGTYGSIYYSEVYAESFPKLCIFSNDVIYTQKEKINDK